MRIFHLLELLFVKQKKIQNDNVLNPAVANRDPYDLRQNTSALFPFEFYVDF